MMVRDISESQARAILKILVEECGYKILDPRDDEAPRYWANSPENAPAIALVAACLKAREASRG